MVAGRGCGKCVRCWVLLVYCAVFSSCRVVSCRPSLSACACASLFCRRFSPPGPICATPPTLALSLLRVLGTLRLATRMRPLPLGVP